MSGGLFVTGLLRETGGSLSVKEIRELNHSHAQAYAKRRNMIRPLPGARDLLSLLNERKVPRAGNRGPAVA
jgi:hypothetical protein